MCSNSSQKGKGPEIALTSFSQRPGPPGPTTQSFCLALQENGSNCHRCLRAPGHKYYPLHHQERKRLYSAYKNAEKQYVSLQSGTGSARAKLAAGWETLQLRDQVNKRFFSSSTDNRGHIQKIVKLESEIRALEVEIANEEKDNAKAKEEQSKKKDQEPIEQGPSPMVRLPLADPRVPMTELDHLSADHPAMLIRLGLDAIRTTRIQKLYALCPALDDSSALVPDDENPSRARQPTERDLIFRLVFREFVAQRAEADVLDRATRTSSIDQFLHESLDLEDYIFFFDVFLHGRQDTLYLLRNAVCDFLLDPLTTSTIHLMGGTIADGSSQQSMTAQGWDLLHVNFQDIVAWWDLPILAFRFGDLVAVKTLTVCL